MSLDAGEVEATLRLKDELSKQISEARKTLQGFGDSAVRVGGTLTAGLTLPIVAIGGASLKMAIDAVESENLFEVAFKGMAAQARDWSERTSEALGLNQFELRRTSGLMFTMFESMGIAKEGAFEMATGLTTLSADMASFFNLKPEEAFDKLKAGITGQSEPLMALGINVKEATIQAYAYKAGIAAQGAELTEQQKVLARYGSILEQTKNAQGDLARTLDSPTNQLRIMRERLNETAVALGMAMLPAAQSVIAVLAAAVPHIRAAVDMFAGLPGPVKLGAIGFVALVAAVGPLLVVFGAMATALSHMLGLLALLRGAQTAAAATTVAQTAATTAGTVATGAATVATGGFAVALRGLARALGPIAIAIGAIWAAWKVGNIDAVQNKIAEWTLRLQGMNAEQARAAVQATAAAAGMASQARESGSLATASTGAAGALQIAAAAAQAEAAALAQSETATKAAATAAKDLVKWKNDQATAYRALLNTMAELEIEEVAQAQKRAKELTELDRKALDDMREQGRRFAEQKIANADAAGLIYLEREKANYEAQRALDAEHWKVLSESRNAAGLAIMAADAARMKSGIGNMVKSLFSDLPNAITAAITGGGDVGGAVGATIFGKLFDAKGPLVGGVTKTLSSTLGSTIGSSLGSIIPGLGTMLGGMAGQLIGPLIGKVGGMFKNLFGGPGGIEVEGRRVAAAFREEIAGLLTETQKAEAGTDEWKLSVIGVRDAFIAAGKTEQEALAIMDRLWKAEKQGGDAVKRVIDEIRESMQRVHETTDETTTAAVNGFRATTNEVDDLRRALDESRADATRLRAEMEIPIRRTIETRHTGGGGGGGSRFSTSARHPQTGETFEEWLARAQPGGDPRVAFAQAFASGSLYGGMDTALEALFGVTGDELAELKRVSGGFATGTPGLGFANFGRGTMAMLHGEEAVVPKGRADEFAMRFGKGEHGEGFNHMLATLVSIEQGLRDQDQRIAVAIEDAMTLGRRRR